MAGGGHSPALPGACCSFAPPAGPDFLLPQGPYSLTALEVAGPILLHPAPGSAPGVMRGVRTDWRLWVMLRVKVTEAAVALNLVIVKGAEPGGQTWTCVWSRKDLLRGEVGWWLRS